MSTAQRILKALEHGPATHKELKLLTGSELDVIRAATASLRLRKLVHIAAYVSGTTRWAMQFALGNKPDAPRPTVLQKDVPVFKRGKRKELILAAIKEGPKTTKELMGITGDNDYKVLDCARQLEEEGHITSRKTHHFGPVTWSLYVERRVLAVPTHASRTRFVNNINPWTGAAV